MHVRETLHLPLSAAGAARMYTDPGYPAIRARVLGADSASAEVTGSAEGAFSVTTTLVMPTEGVPDIARRFVGSTVSIREHQSWQAPTEDGSRSGTIELTIAGVPASMTGTAQLRPAGENASEVEIDGDLRARIPLVGARLEKAAAPYVSQVLARESRSAEEYVRSQG